MSGFYGNSSPRKAWERDLQADSTLFVPEAKIHSYNSALISVQLLCTLGGPRELKITKGSGSRSRCLRPKDCS